MFWLFTLVGFICIGLELVLPGGILGILGSISLIFAVGRAYLTFDLAIAHGILAGFVLSSILLVSLWFRYFPQSKIGRFFVANSTVGSLGELPGPELGALGKATSPLRPTGMASFGEHRVEVTTRGEYIETETSVEVVERKGRRIVVREK